MTTRYIVGDGMGALHGPAAGIKTMVAVIAVVLAGVWIGRRP